MLSFGYGDCDYCCHCGINLFIYCRIITLRQPLHQLNLPSYILESVCCSSYVVVEHSHAKAFAYESITVGATAVSLTAATYTDSDSQKAKRAIITTEAASFRYRYDGTAPTASEGHLVTQQSVIIIVGSDNISNFQAIRTGATSAVIKVTYEN